MELLNQLALLHFNSLMVRLESNAPKKSTYDVIFQFLNGAIGVSKNARILTMLRLFQFLNGAIGVVRFKGKRKP